MSEVKAGQDLMTPEGLRLLMPHEAMAEVRTGADQPLRKSPWKPKPLERRREEISHLGSSEEDE